MRKSVISFAAPIAVAFTLSLGVVAAPASADDKQDIEALMPKFEEAVKIGGAADVASFYTKDGLMLPPELPSIEGRESIQTYWQDLFDAGATSFKLTSTEVQSSGDFAYQVGTFAFERGTETETVPVSGKYLNVWRRNKDGLWRPHRNIWNEDAAK